MLDLSVKSELLIENLRIQIVLKLIWMLLPRLIKQAKAIKLKYKKLNKSILFYKNNEKGLSIELRPYFFMAEKKGFEPLRPVTGLRAFQARPFSRLGISPFRAFLL